MLKRIMLYHQTKFGSKNPKQIKKDKKKERKETQRIGNSEYVEESPVLIFKAFPVILTLKTANQSFLLTLQRMMIPNHYHTLVTKG